MYHARPDELVGALKDSIHVDKGRLISVTPIKKPQKPVIEIDELKEMRERRLKAISERLQLQEILLARDKL